MSVTVEHLTRATKRLREHPHDQGAWLELAAIHHALGNTDDAELMFATIGEGARVGGQVALAVACGRHLAELGSVRGPELIDHVVETYAKDGSHIAARDTHAAPAPPEETREDVWVLEIPARAVETAAQKHPKLAEVLAHHARTRLLANLMRTSELFRALDDDDRDALLARFEIELVPAGQTFIHEGKGNAHLWVLVSGKCQVQSTGSPLADLGPGAAVGEISLVSGTTAVASVIAVESAVLLRLSKSDFTAVAKKHPKLLAEVEKLVVARETANRALFQDAADLIV